ncbi:MAG: translocation/assembly module TamB domain-containing protein [Candidatus Aminicenantes bacterium]
MRIKSVFRIRELIRRLIQRIRRIAVAFLVLGFLGGSLVVGRSVLVGEIRKELSKTFAYDDLQISSFPPAILLKEVRTLTDPPLFRARAVKVEMPLWSLLRNRKAVSVVFDSPELRIGPEALRPRAARARPALSLPFNVDRGVVRDGAVLYEGGGTRLEVRGIEALFTQRGDQFTLRAGSDDAKYESLPGEAVLLAGLDISLSGRGDNITVQQLKIEGPDVLFEGRGRLRAYRDPEIELDTRFEIETAGISALLDLPFDWKGKVGGEGKFLRKSGEISVETTIAADGLVLSDVPMGRIRGGVRREPGKDVEVDVVIQKPGLLPETLTLAIGGGRVEGRAGRLFIDPVFNEIEMPWPVRSPVWGTFIVRDGKLEAAAEFRDTSLERVGDRFAFRGGAEVFVDFRTKEIRVATPDLQSNFARLEARVAIDLDGDIDTRIRGSVLDVRQAREFVSLILDETFDFGEIRGAGFAEVSLSGRSAAPVVDIRGTFSSVGFDLLDAAFVDADTRITAQGFTGTFKIDDPELKGEVRVAADAAMTEVEVRGGEGELARIFPALEIPVSLRGRAAGDFRIVRTNGEEEYSGTFSSPEISGYGQTARDVAGRLEFRNGVLAFPEMGLDLHGGRFEGRLLIGLVDGEFDVDLRGRDVDLSLLSSDAAGALSLTLVGRGVFGSDTLGGAFSVRDLLFSPLEKTEARGDLELGYEDGQVVLGIKGGLASGENPFEARVDIPTTGEPFRGTVKGTLGNLDLLLPWDGALGRVDYAADIVETDDSTRITVTTDFRGSVLPLPGFPYAVTDFSGAARYEEGALTVTAFAGRLGGGTIQGTGELRTGPDGIETMDMRAEARDMNLSPAERVRVQVEGTLRMLKDKQRFVLEGDLMIKRLNWRREIYEEFSFYAAADPEEDPGPSFFDGLTLNLRLQGDDNVIVENSLGRLSGRFSLAVTGSLENPVLLGDVDIRSGDIYFQDRAFRVLYGRLSFTDPLRAEPFLDFRGETYVKDYRVTLSMNGPVSRMRPEFSSSPPLPPDEVLALLAMGESFRRTYYTYSMDRSTAMSTASLLTYQIADQAKKRASGVFTLDRFRIDPYFSESSPGSIAARLTVGKKLSGNLLIIYSTILANSNVLAAEEEFPIFRMEWDISRRFSLVGGQDDRGKLSFDVKYRKRF